MRKCLIALVALIPFGTALAADKERDKVIFNVALLFNTAMTAEKSCPNIEMDDHEMNQFMAALNVHAPDMPSVTAAMDAIRPYTDKRLREDGVAKFCSEVIARIGPDGESHYKLLKVKAH